MANNINELQPSSNQDLKNSTSLKFRTAPFGPPIVRDNELQNPGRLKFGSKSGNAYGQNEQANFFLVDTFTQINAKTDNWKSGPSYNSIATDFFTEHCGFYTSPGGPSCRWENYAGTGNPHKHSGMAAKVDKSGSGKAFVYDVGHATKTNKDMECYEYGVVGISGLVFPDHDDYYDNADGDGSQASVGVQHIYGMYRCDLTKEKYDELEDIQTGVTNKIEALLEWLEDIAPGMTENRLFKSIREKGFREGTKQLGFKPEEFDETWSFKSLVDEIDWEQIRNRSDRRKRERKFFDPKFGRRLDNILGTLTIPNNEMGKHILSLIVELFQTKFLKVDASTQNDRKALLYDILKEKGSIDGKDIFNWLLRCKMGDEEYIDKWQGKFNFDNIFDWFKGIDEDTYLTVGETYFLYNCYFHQGFKDKDEYGRYTCLINGNVYTYNSVNYNENYTGPVVDAVEAHAYSVAQASKESYAPSVTDDDLALFSDNQDNVINDSDMNSKYSLEDYCSLYGGVYQKNSPHNTCVLQYGQHLLDDSNYKDRQSFRNWCKVIAGSLDVIEHPEYSECPFEIETTNQTPSKTFREFCVTDLKGTYGTHNLTTPHEDDPFIRQLSTGTLKFGPSTPADNYPSNFIRASENERCFFPYGMSNFTGSLWNDGSRGMNFWGYLVNGDRYDADEYVAPSGNYWMDGPFNDPKNPNKDYFSRSNWLNFPKFENQCLGAKGKFKDVNGNSVTGYSGEVTVDRGEIICTRYNIPEFNQGGGGLVLSRYQPVTPNFDMYWVPNSLFKNGYEYDYDIDWDESDYSTEREELIEAIMEGDAPPPEYNKYITNPKPIIIEPKSYLKSRIYNYDQSETDYLYRTQDRIYRKDLVRKISVACITSSPTAPKSGTECEHVMVHGHEPANFDFIDPYYNDGTFRSIEQSFLTEQEMRTWVNQNKNNYDKDIWLGVKASKESTLVLWEYKRNGTFEEIDDNFYGFFGRESLLASAQDQIYKNDSNARKYAWYWNYQEDTAYNVQTYAKLKNKPWKVGAVITTTDEVYAGTDLTRYPILEKYTSNEFFWYREFEDFCTGNYGELRGDKFKNKKYNPQLTCNFDKRVRAVETKNANGTIIPPTNPELKGQVEVTLGDFQRNNQFKDDFCDNLNGTYSTRNRRYEFSSGAAIEDTRKFYKNTQEELCTIDLTGFTDGLIDFEEWTDKYGGKYYEKLKFSDIDEDFHIHDEDDLGKEVAVFEAGYFPLTKEEYIGDHDNMGLFADFEDWCIACADQNNTRITSMGMPSFQASDDLQILPERLPTVGYKTESKYSINNSTKVERCQLYRKDVLKTEKFSSPLPMSFRSWCNNSSAFAYTMAAMISPGWEYDFETETWDEMEEELIPTCFNPFMFNANTMNKHYYDNMTAYQDLNYYCKRSNASYYRSKDFLPEFLHPAYNWIFRTDADEQRAFCLKFVDVEWDYTFESWCDNYEGVLGEAETEDGIPLGNACTLEGVDFPFLEEFWDDSPDGFRFWCALNGGTNINGNNPEMSDDVSILFEGDGCSIETIDEETLEEKVLFFTWSDSGGFKIPYGEYLPYLRNRESFDDIYYGESDVSEIDPDATDSVDIIKAKDLFKYTPTTIEYKKRDDTIVSSYYYPLEKYLYQSRSVPTYRSNGVDRRPEFKDVTIFIPIRLNFENSDVSKLAVESPAGNKFVIQLWYTAQRIDDTNYRTVNMTPGITVGPGETVGVEIPRNYSYIYVTEINQNAPDEDYITGKMVPLVLTDYNNVGMTYIYPTNNWDEVPNLSEFIQPTNAWDFRQLGNEVRFIAHNYEWPSAVGMQLWWSEYRDKGPYTKGERLNFDVETTAQVLGKYAIFAMVDPTFKFGQDPVSIYLNGIGPTDSLGRYYIEWGNTTKSRSYAYLTDDERKQPDWQYYSKPFKGEAVQAGDYEVYNNSIKPIILYYQGAPLDPTDQTKNPVKLLGNSRPIGPGQKSSFKVSDKGQGNIIVVIIDPDPNAANDFPRDGQPIDVKFNPILSDSGNTDVVWQDEVNVWSDPFWNASMVDEFPDDPLTPIDESSPEENGYISDRNTLVGKKFERDSVYEGENQSRSGDTYLQMWWNNSQTIRSLDTLKKGILLDPGASNKTEFVALDEYAFFGSYRNNYNSRKEWGSRRRMFTSFEKKQGEGSRGNATAYWGVYTNNQPPNWAKYNKPIKYIQVSKGSTYTITNGSSKDYEITCFFADTATPPPTITTDWAQRTVTLTKSNSTKTKVAKGKFMYVMASTPQGSFEDYSSQYIDIRNEEEWGSNGRKVVINLRELDNEIGASGASGITWPGGSGIGATDFPWPGGSLFPGASWPGASKPEPGSSRPSIGASGGTEGIISSGFLFRLIYDLLNRYTNQDLDDLGYIGSWLLALAIEEVCIILYAIGIGEILAIVAMVIYGTEALVSGIAGKFRKVDVVAEFYKDGGNNELTLGRGVKESQGGDLSTFCKWPDLQARFMNLTANEYVRAYLKYTFCRSNGYLFHITAPADRRGLFNGNYDKIRTLRIANIANTYSFGFVQMEAPGYRKVLRRYYDMFQPIGDYAPGSDGASSISDSDWNVGDGTGTKNYSRDLGIEYETTLELDVRKDTIRNQPFWNEEEMWFKIDLSRAIRGEHQKKVKLRGGNYYYIGKLGADKAGDAAENQSWVNGVTESSVGVEEGAYAWNVFNGAGAGTKYKSYYDDIGAAKNKHKTWAWEVTAGEPDWWPIQIPEDGGVPGIEFNMKQLNIDKKNSSESDSFRIYTDWQINFIHLTFQEYETVNIIQENENLPNFGEVIGTEQVLGKYRVFPLMMDSAANIPYKMRMSWEKHPGVTDEDQLLNPGDSLYMKCKAYKQGPVSGDLFTNRHGVDGKIYPNYKFVGFSVSAAIGEQAHLARFRSFLFRYIRPLLYVKDRNGEYNECITLNDARENGTYVVPNFKKDLYQADVDLSPYTEKAPNPLPSPVVAPDVTTVTPPTPSPSPSPSPGGYGY